MISYRRAILFFMLSTMLASIPGETSFAQSGIQVRDIGVMTGFQDTTFGHHKRGRANIAADFDLDGYLDFYLGNPGDESYVLRSRPAGGGSRKFELVQVLIDSAQLTWGGVAFDYDNDGDPDLFLACGGNEGVGFDYLWRNNWITDNQVTGDLSFTDVTAEAGIAGIIPEGERRAIKTSSGNAVAADYDDDGDLDLFVNGNTKTLVGHPELEGRNTLWKNNGDGTFTDVTEGSGLAAFRGSTRHSTWFDFDNDLDMDLYENVFRGCNVLWRNDGTGSFTDVTAEMSGPSEDLSDPFDAFASVAADFNNDGWEDLMVFMRGGGDGASRKFVTGDCGCNDCPFPINSEMLTACDGVEGYPPGHALFMNQNGEKFKNVAGTAGFNDGFLEENGVMGCQIGDLNGDGIPDIYIGNGGPDSGAPDRLFISTGLDEERNPRYENVTSLIDFPAIIPAGWAPVSYPYRTHGIAFVDFDNDGQLEVAVANGGPVSRPDTVREPNRLFSFRFLSPGPRHFLKVRLVGNGSSVSRDAVGTRVKLLGRDGSGPIQQFYRTVYGGSAFSAQNGFDLMFGLGDVDRILEVVVFWPDGTESRIAEGIPVNSSITITLHESKETTLRLEVPSTPILSEDSEPLLSLEGNFPNPFNPSTLIRYTLENPVHVTVRIFSVLGEEIRTLVDQFQPAGLQSVVWDGRTSWGSQTSSGVYIFRVEAGQNVETGKMLLTR